MAMNSTLVDAILATSHDAIVVTGTTGLIIRWNPAAEQLLGYRADEMIGYPIRTILPESWWLFFEDRLTVLKNRQIVRCDSVRRHKNGALIDVHATSYGLFDSHDQFIGYINVFKDLKEHNEKNLTNAFLASIVRASPDAIASTDIYFKLLTWNEAAESMFGVSLASVKGRKLGAIIPNLASHVDMLRVDQPSHRRIDRSETTFERQDGTSIAISTTISSILNAAGVPIGWSLTCTDITDKKKEEQFRRFVMKELSHRAKNLLAVIMAMFRSSAETKGSFAEFEQDFAARVQGLARSHDLLVQNDWQGASLHGLVATQLQPFVGSVGRLQTSGPDVTLSPAAVQCMGLALHELGTNSVKYGALSSVSGRIVVETVRSSDCLQISWTETGGPVVVEPSRSGFGRIVLEDMIADATGGKAHLEFRSCGVKWTARIPQ